MTGMLSKNGGAAITIVDSATSSSDLVWAAAAQDAPSGTAFLVREQTAGRGRRGAGWSSARGGMYFSILLRPAISQRLWFGLSFVAALAIRQELARCLADVPVMLKWPNDVLAGGGKLCGILLEGRGEAVVIGTGVNIAPVDGVPGAKLPATSLVQLGDSATDPETLARSYADALMSRVAAYEADGFDPVRQEWLSHCAHIEGMMRIARPEKSEGLRVGADNSGMNNIVEGRFAGLGADGALHLVQDDGERHVITTGDVDLMG